MRQFAFILAALAPSLFRGADAASIAGRSPAPQCEGAVVTKTSKIGHVDITHFACPNGFGPLRSSARSETNVVQARQEGFCDTAPGGGPAPNCVDSEPCNSSDVPYINYGVKTDCDQVTATLENTLGAFSVAPGSMIIASYQTCAFRWDNLGVSNSTLEYSYWNFGSVGASMYLWDWDIYGISSGICYAKDFVIIVQENLY